MRQSGTTLFIIVCVAVLLGTWAIDLFIRQVRFSNARIESNAATKVDKAGIEPEREFLSGRYRGNAYKVRSEKPQETEVDLKVSTFVR